MTTEPTQLPVRISDESISKLALAGDVSPLTQAEKIAYYKALCDRVGLDAATQPFKLMKLSGKEVFYLDRSGAQQLNHLHKISHQVTARELVNGCYVVTARASIGERFTDSLGAVHVEGLRGEALANAFMKAETKAKRRATLDLVGLGMLDETEVETIPGAVVTSGPSPSMPEMKPIETPRPQSEQTEPSDNDGGLGPEPVVFKDLKTTGTRGEPLTHIAVVVAELKPPPQGKKSWLLKTKTGDTFFSTTSFEPAMPGDKLRIAYHENEHQGKIYRWVHDWMPFGNETVTP